MCSIYFKQKDSIKVKGRRKKFYININHKESEMEVLISDKYNFRKKNITRDKETHIKMIHCSMHK